MKKISLGMVSSTAGFAVLPRFRRCQAGSNAVEFALVAPVLLLLMFAMVHFGALIATAHSLAQISADAARYAMVGRTAEERAALVERHLDRTAGAFVTSPRTSLTFEVVEDQGAMSVVITQDVSFIPPVPILEAVYQAPATLTRASLVMIP